MSLDSDLTRLRLLAEARANGASWAAIGRTLGKDPKVAKRDAKRLARKTSRAAWQQESATREAVLQEAAITADGWCAAHHCFPSECSSRTHVHTVRLLNSLWERVAATAAAKGMDTNAGVTAALEAWAAGEGLTVQGSNGTCRLHGRRHLSHGPHKF